MNNKLKKVCAVTVIGTLLVGSAPMYEGLAASKKLKVNSKKITMIVGKTKVLSTNMKATFKSSNKKVVSLKKVKKKNCTLVAKKQGKCTIIVKAKKQKTIKVNIVVKKKNTTVKPTAKPVVTPTINVTETPNVIVPPTETPVVTVTPTSIVTPEPTEAVKETAAPEVTEEVKETIAPEVTEEVKETAAPESTEEVKKTAAPEITEEVKETIAPESTEEVKATLEPQVTESVKPTATPVVTSSAILPEDTDTMGGKVNSIGYNLSKLLAETKEEDGNRVISPYSIIMALTMLDNGADKETKEEIEKALGITDLDAWNKEFGEHFKNNCNDVIQNHEEDKKQDEEDIFSYKDTRFEPELSCANSFWYNDTELSFDSKEQKDYMNKLKNNFLAECKPLDFSNPNKNPKVDLNRWVEEKTNNKIKNLFIEDIKTDVASVLVNTLYFNGCWAETFDKYFTTEEDFYGKDKTSKVDMMYQSKKYYSYYEKDNIMGVELPFYGDHDLVMDIITSKEQNQNAIDIYEQMSNTEKNNFYESLGEAKDVPVNLHLPKFKLEYGAVNLNEIMKKLGIEQAFDEYSANLPGIRGENEENVFVDSVVHKAVIEVGEKGATAAAATAIIMDATTAIDPTKEPEPIDFNVNRPFVFAIRDKKTNMIYFMGQIQNLEKGK